MVMALWPFSRSSMTLITLGELRSTSPRKTRRYLFRRLSVALLEGARVIGGR